MIIDFVIYVLNLAVWAFITFWWQKVRRKKLNQFIYALQSWSLCNE